MAVFGSYCTCHLATVRRIPREAQAAQHCKIEEYFKSSSKECENEKGKTYEIHFYLHGGGALRIDIFYEM